MNKFYEFIKTHIGTIAPSITVVVTIIACTIAVDKRYAHQEDLMHVKNQNSAEIVNVTRQNQAGIKQLRISMIEDKIFEIETRGGVNMSSIDIALINRYKRQLERLKGE